jgi:hypothetical protein
MHASLPLFGEIHPHTKMERLAAILTLVEEKDPVFKVLSA